MANEEHLAILRQGVEAWNSWRVANPDVKPELARARLFGMDLRRADLRGVHMFAVNLSEANLSRANLGMANLGEAHLGEAVLVGAELSKADLSAAILSKANLTRANLSGSILCEANFGGANLREADISASDLRRANLGGADLTRAILVKANLADTLLGDTVFDDNDLSDVEGLDSVRHVGPSIIGINTLYKSGDKLSSFFLRGCGVPDTLIEYLPSLIGPMKPTQFYSCFISYSSKDEDFTRRLYSRMCDKHLRVWFADEDMKAGEKLYEQIDQAIRIQDKLVLVLSEHSIQSEWVMTEIRKARKAELKSGRRKLFPIRLIDMETLREWECFDADTGKDLAVEVREYFIPDFTQWKDHDSFERAFARFLKDLQATEAPPIPRQAPKVSDEARSGTQQPVIEIKKRRLQLLEEQQARKGHDTEPHILMEIEDLRREISDLEAGLE